MGCLVNSDLWKAKGLPHKGWALEDVEDTGSPSTDCEWCGTQIRYVHHIYHQETGRSSAAGCICAEALTQDYSRTGRRKEAVLKKTASMASKWVHSPRWNTKANGNIYRKDKKLFILLFRKNNLWKIKVGDDWGAQSYPTLEEAKMASLRQFLTLTN